MTSAFLSNSALSGDPGSLPNELLQISGVGTIASLTITGDPTGDSFVADDLQFTTIVPEPGTLLLSSSILGFFVMRRLLQVRRL